MTKPDQARGPEENDRLDSFLDVISQFVGNVSNKKILDKREIVDSLNNSKEKLVNKKELIDLLIDTLADKYVEKNSKGDDSGLVAKELSIPVEIFSQSLSPLEALVKYLRENVEMSVNEIASQLNRDTATIWTTYKNSLKKQSATFKFEEGETQKIPLTNFGNRNLSAAEVVVYFLKEKGLKYSEIGELLNRDQRNIWSTFARAKKKLASEKTSPGAYEKGKDNAKKEVKDE